MRLALGECVLGDCMSDEVYVGDVRSKSPAHDLSKKITVDFHGEILLLKETLDRYSGSARKRMPVTRSSWHHDRRRGDALTWTLY